MKLELYQLYPGFGRVNLCRIGGWEFKVNFTAQVEGMLSCWETRLTRFRQKQ